MYPEEALGSRVHSASIMWEQIERLFNNIRNVMRKSGSARSFEFVFVFFFIFFFVFVFVLVFVFVFVLVVFLVFVFVFVLSSCSCLCFVLVLAKTLTERGKKQSNRWNVECT
jgi:hypothetical protein